MTKEDTFKLGSFLVNISLQLKFWWKALHIKKIFLSICVYSWYLNQKFYSNLNLLPPLASNVTISLQLSTAFMSYHKCAAKMRHSIPYAITHAHYLLDGPCYLSYSAQGSKARFDNKIVWKEL